MHLKIITTNDGSKTLQVPKINEQYHSLNGAITESNHVYLKSGYLYSGNQNPVVFEVGFGTGLNCLLTAITAQKEERNTLFISIEKYPLKYDLINQLNFTDFLDENATVLFEQIHSCKWNSRQKISDFFELLKIEDDLLDFDFSELNSFDVIYFDAFGPDKQPEMWHPSIFKKIYEQTARDGIFVTYSAKGEVRRQLQNCGYKIERLPGPPGKKEMLRGIK